MSNVVNSFRIQVPDLEVDTYDIQPQPGDDSWYILNDYEKSVKRGSAHTYKEDGRQKIAVIGLEDPPERIEAENGALEHTGKRELNYSTRQDAEMMEQALTQELRGYLTRVIDEYWERGKSREYYEQGAKSTVGDYDAFHGYKTSIDCTQNGEFYLTIDTTVKFVHTDSLGKKIHRMGAKEAEEEFKGQYFTIHSPRRDTVELISIDDSATVSDTEIDHNGERKTVKEYIEDEYPERMSRRVAVNEPVAQIRFPWKEDPVPSAPSLLHATPDGMSNRLTKYSTRSSEGRWSDTLEFVRQIRYLEVYDSPKMTVENNPRKADDIFDYPQLSFGSSDEHILSIGTKDDTSDRNRLIQTSDWGDAQLDYLKEFGPSYKPRGISKVAVFYPEGKKQMALDAYDDVREYVEDFTGLSLQEDPGNVAYTDTTKFKKWTRRYADDHQGAFVLFDSQNGHYYDIVEGMNGKAVQGINSDTYNEVHGSNRFDYTLFNTAMGLASKLGVRPQLLGDSLSSDIYLGMDVAGDEVNSASAVLVDGRDGNLVTQTERNLATGNSTVTPQHIAEKIVENLLLDGVDAERRHNIESITLHRRGDFGDEELHGMKNKIDELRGDGNLSEDVTVSAVEISENSIYRLYDNDEYVSETGSYARVDSDQIAVVTYGDPQIHQGTPNPILCTRKLGGADLDTIGRDIFFLSFLDWGAPTSKIKRPITTHLPKEMHDILERGLSVRYPPF